MARPGWETFRIYRFVKRVFRSVSLFLLCTVITPGAVMATVLLGFLFLPLPATLPEAKPTLASQFTHIYDAKGNEIAQFREFEQSIPFAKADVPEVLNHAVVAAEDQRFYQHGGVDLKGSLRAFITDIRGGQVSQGGSTITQQYVKNAYTGSKRTLARKVQEAVLASQLDRQVKDKNEILYRYLSVIYLGDGAYGAEAASETYFRHPVKDLTLSEAALLVGLIPAPTRYAPRENPTGAEAKRQLVLKKMLDQKWITQDEFDAAIVQKVYLAVKGPLPPGVPATVVWPEQQQVTQYPYFVDYVRRYLIEKYGQDMVFRGGLEVSTTLDPDLQAAAEKTVADSLAGTNPDLDMAIASIQPQDGSVRALVGGRDFYDPVRGQVNFALGGCEDHAAAGQTVVVPATCWDGGTVVGGGSGRQPGSAFKPFTLAAAFAQGIPPTKVYPGRDPYIIPGCKPTKTNGCAIHNAADGEGSGSMDLRTATVHSVNTVYAQLINDIGVEKVAEMAKKLGITTAWYSPQVHGLSYTLGVLDVSPIDMASAYGVFDNHGLRAPPTPVALIKGPKGETIEDNTDAKAKAVRVIDAAVADNVTDVLKGVITSGTAYPNAVLDRPAAGKTGTTDNYVNAWFVGYTPTLSTSVWMGYAQDAKTSMVNIKGVKRVFGGTLPAKAWKQYMTAAMKDVPITEFDQPAPIRDLADQVRRQARGGIDPGARSGIKDTPAGGPYIVGPPAPAAQAPATTTTTIFEPETTTTTTKKNTGSTTPPPTLFGP